MPLNAINISITDDVVSSTFVSDVLFELGALSVSTSDLDAGQPNEEPIYSEPPPPTWEQPKATKAWKNSKITALYPLTTDVQSLVMIIGTEFDLNETPTLSIYADTFDEKTPEEWIRQVQASFKPVVLDKVRISFPWHSTQKGIIDIKIEPGAAFGTGEHATTQMCLMWLQKIMHQNSRIRSVLDFGTGSGVLAIGACKLSEQRSVSAVGVEIDPMALNAARQNAVLNQLDGSQLNFYENKDEPSNNVYDVVVANILARPLKELAPLLVSRLRKGGFIAMSGVLITQAPQLIQHYAKFGISMYDAQVKDGWALVVGRKA